MTNEKQHCKYCGHDQTSITDYGVREYCQKFGCEKVFYNNDWVKVEDKLPDFDIKVLAIDGNQAWVAERWMNDKEDRFDPILNTINFYSKPTHWMPLPKLPVEHEM
jgi:hypothetical protein